MEKKKRFVLIDALSLAYKAYFAFITRPLSTSKGEPTSAVYGFLTQLFKIIEDTKPDYIAVAFDSKEKTFRHERYEGYKASRQEMPDDMIPQIERIKEVVEAFKMPVYILPGYEADDLIGTAVKKAAEKGFEAIAVTPDKDYIQLVSENIKIIKPGKRTDEIIVIDLDKVKEQFGFANPKQMIDYLALVGDSSDDIPGVKGIGPKTALPLIQKFGSIENIYANLDKIEKQSIVKKLEENRENAFLSKELATIKLDVPFELNFDEAKFKQPDFEKINKLFAELEFKNLGAKLLKIFPEFRNEEGNEEIEEPEEMFVFDKSKVDYRLITNEEDAKRLAEELLKSELFVFDTETDSLNYLHANIVGVSFALKAGTAYFVPVNPFKQREDLFQKDLSDRLNIIEFVKIFKPVFENKEVKKVCQNGKYDIGVLRTNGIETENFYFDTMLASYVYDPDEKHGMDDLARTYLNYSPIPFSEIANKKNPDSIYDVDIEVLKNYAAEDSDITFRLYEIFKRKLKEENLNEVAYNVEFPLVYVLEEMERTGVKLDVESLNNFSKELEILLDRYTEQIYNIAGTKFNINSTKQLQEILFGKLGLKPTKKTKTGFSTDARSLEALRGQHDIIDLLLNYRQISKLKSTYADALPKLIDKDTGRIHTTYNQTVASTGRLSSLDPNLQNIPIRTELGKEIRKAFIPTDDNYVILSADYSQIELRIMASICKDDYLTEAFKKGEDIHRHTAALVFNVKPEDVTPEMRRKAKEVNFGILYGIGAFGLKTRLGISQTHAQEIIDNYFSTFKNVKSYMEEAVRKAREKGFAETLLGRRRFLKNINSKNRTVRQFEERVAINMPIQGTAADMIKLAMIKIHNELKKRKFKTKMVLQVHDELVFDAYKDELDEVKDLIKDLMENALPLNVPVKVDVGIGKNWLEAH